MGGETTAKCKVVSPEHVIERNERQLGATENKLNTSLGEGRNIFLSTYERTKIWNGRGIIGRKSPGNRWEIENYRPKGML